MIKMVLNCAPFCKKNDQVSLDPPDLFSSLNDLNNPSENLRGTAPLKFFRDETERNISRVNRRTHPDLENTSKTLDEYKTMRRAEVEESEYDRFLKV